MALVYATTAIFTLGQRTPLLAEQGGTNRLEAKDNLQSKQKDTGLVRSIRAKSVYSSRAHLAVAPVADHGCQPK
jgi:hypothetical protein